jgi:hypothetical protein
MRINVVAVFGVRRVNFNLVEYRPGRDLDPDFRATSVDTSKPATARHFKTGHHGRGGRDQ